MPTVRSKRGAVHGASFGRDLYRSAKKNPVILGIVGALLLAFGWRNLFLGYGRSFAYFLFVNLIGSLIMILIGASLVGLVVYTATGIFAENNPQLAVLLTLAAIGSLSLIGIFWGRSDRRTRIRRVEVEMRNLAFLHEQGFSESEFESDQMVDPEGHILKQIEQTDQKIVFSVMGRRGLRAAIRLQDGEMISYTGVQRAA